MYVYFRVFKNGIFSAIKWKVLGFRETKYREKKPKFCGKKIKILMDTEVESLSMILNHPQGQQ